MNRIFSKTGVLVSLLSMCLGAAALAQSTTNMDILRDKVAADKKLLIAANLSLTEAQATAFWPIYDDYQRELTALNQRIGRLVQTYADEYNAGSVSDASAKSLLAESIDIDEAEVALRKRTAAKLEGVIPAIEAARYIQMESKIRALIRFDLAANIPLAE
jgi:Spy/CpxP family protein refolding chaperone